MVPATPAAAYATSHDGSYCVSPYCHLFVLASRQWVQTHCPFAEFGMSPPHAAEHEGVMSRGGMKKNGMPSICITPWAAGGKKEGTREVQLCIQQLVLNLCLVRQDG